MAQTLGARESKKNIMHISIINRKKNQKGRIHKNALFSAPPTGKKQSGGILPALQKKKEILITYLGDKGKKDLQLHGGEEKKRGKRAGEQRGSVNSRRIVKYCSGF